MGNGEVGHRERGGHWCLAAASIAAEVTVIQVVGLWAFPTQWGEVRVCVGEEPECQVTHPHGGCPDSMGGVLVSWATMQGVGGSFIQGVGTTARGWGWGLQLWVPVPQLLGLLGLQAQLLRGGFPWFCLLYVF